VVNVIYGVCTNSLQRLETYVMPRIGNRPLVALWNQTSIAQAYNAIIDAVKVQHPELLILLHDDLELVDPRGEEKLLEVVRDDVALVGVAGGRHVASLAWWNHETYGHQKINSGMLDLGPRTGDVDLLEGSLLALTPWAYTHLRFDEALSGFHGYDEISMQARRAGKRVVVADVDTFHHTNIGFTSPDSERQWFLADAHFRSKWNL
jgi:hypothetical protein